MSSKFEYGLGFALNAESEFYKSVDGRIVLVYFKGDGFPSLEDLVLTPEVLLGPIKNSISELEDEFKVESLAGLTYRITPISYENNGYYDEKEDCVKIFLSTYDDPDDISVPPYYEPRTEFELAQYSRFLLQDSDARQLYNLFVKKCFSGQLGPVENKCYTRLEKEGKELWKLDIKELFFKILRGVIRHETMHRIHSNWGISEASLEKRYQQKIIESEEITADMFKEIFSTLILTEGLACLVHFDYEPHISMEHGAIFNTIYRTTLERAGIIHKGKYDQFVKDLPWEYRYCAGEYLAATLFRAFGKEKLLELYSSGHIGHIIESHQEACRKLTSEYKEGIVPVF